jgi:uncharacterized radical SAM protein YgiQ
MPFLPTTPEELRQRGIDRLDVILITGDSYIDSPFIGAAVIGRVLEAAGFRVGIIAQPKIDTPADIARLGEPRLFWGVTGGSVDSLVANYTASKRKRHSDDYTPGGQNTRRPDRAVIAYTNLLRRSFKNTVPIVLGGIEASLRRMAHYDFWSDGLRRSILFDAKADYLIYGMAESAVVDLARALLKGTAAGAGVLALRGLCYIAREIPPGYLELPAYETVVADKDAFIEMFHQFYQNTDPLTAKGLAQRHGDRYLIQNHPALTPTQAQMDAVYALPFERSQHPYYEVQGPVKALQTIRFAISTHRGCYGECNFCSIAVHEGRTVRWRSTDSVVSEAEQLARLPGFKGYIQDVGGPSANMYGFECAKKLRKGSCEDKRCLYPTVCPALKPDHNPQIELLRRVRSVAGVKKAFIASGLRYDLVLADKSNGKAYLREVVRHHVSGQMKVAPEHSEDRILRLMGKPGRSELLGFKKMFDDLTLADGKPQYLTYYLIAGYPGCTDTDMQRLKEFAGEALHISPEEVQIFVPLPSTYSALMYYTGLDPWTREPLFIERDPSRRERQKAIVVSKPERVNPGQPGMPRRGSVGRVSQPASLNPVNESHKTKGKR